MQHGSAGGEYWRNREAAELTGCRVTGWKYEHESSECVPFSLTESVASGNVAGVITDQAVCGRAGSVSERAMSRVCERELPGYLACLDDWVHKGSKMRSR